MSGPPAKYGIFLSHSAADAELVRGIRAQIEAIGVGVYLYEEHHSPGTRLAPRLQRAIAENDALVVLLTPNSVVRSYVQQEIGYALGRSKPAVALVTPGVPSDALAMLTDREYIRLDPNAPLQGMAELLNDLYDRAGRKQRKDELMMAMLLIGFLVLLALTASESGKA